MPHGRGQLTKRADLQYSRHARTKLAHLTNLICVFCKFKKKAVIGRTGPGQIWIKCTSAEPTPDATRRAERLKFVRMSVCHSVELCCCVGEWHVMCWLVDFQDP